MTQTMHSMVMHGMQNTVLYALYTLVLAGLQHIRVQPWQSSTVRLTCRPTKGNAIHHRRLCNQTQTVPGKALEARADRLLCCIISTEQCWFCMGAYYTEQSTQ